MLVVYCFCLCPIVVFPSSEAALGAKETKGAREQKRKIANVISAFNWRRGKKKYTEYSLKPLHHFCKTHWFCAPHEHSGAYRLQAPEWRRSITHCSCAARLSCTHLLGVPWWLRQQESCEMLVFKLLVGWRAVDGDSLVVFKYHDFCVSGSPLVFLRMLVWVFFFSWKIASKVGSNASSLIVI